MAKKGKDLFELLQARAKGGLPAPKKAPPPQLPSVVEQVGQRLKVWFGGGAAGAAEGGKARRGRGAKAGSRAAPAAGLSGVGLAGVVLTALVLGFGLGRWTAGTTPPTEELRSSAPQPRTPQGFPEAPPGPLSTAEETATLSNFFYPVLGYRQAEQASKLVGHLRQNGCPTARYRHVERNEGSFWLVLVYVQAEDAAAANEAAPHYLERLRTVPVPDFEPKLTTAIENTTLRQLRQS